MTAHKTHPRRNVCRKGRTCFCQVGGAIRPECLRGIIGWLDAQGVRHFAPLPCAFDVTRLLDAPPTHHTSSRGGYEHPGNYSHEKRCASCGCPICNTAKSHCRSCANKVNGGKNNGGSPNEAWRVSMSPRRRARPAPAPTMGAGRQRQK